MNNNDIIRGPRLGCKVDPRDFEGSTPLAYRKEVFANLMAMLPSSNGREPAHRRTEYK